MFQLPSLPEGIHRVLILIGAACIAASFYAYKPVSEKNDTWYIRSTSLLDSMASFEIELDVIKDELLKTDENLAKRYNRKRIITEDTAKKVLYFDGWIKGDAAEISYTDSIQKLWRNWKVANSKYAILNKRFDLLQERIRNDEKNDNQTYILSILFAILAVIFVIGGLNGLQEKENQTSELLRRQNISLPRYFYRCQSCCRKFSPMLCYGTNDDASLNYSFCSECYSNGAFIEPNLTINDMEQKVFSWSASLSKKRQKKLLKTLRLLSRWEKDYF